jgi:hypothetical protein
MPLVVSELAKKTTIGDVAASTPTRPQPRFVTAKAQPRSATVSSALVSLPA